MKVAVLDTNQEFMEMVRMLLEDDGFEVITGEITDLKRCTKDVIQLIDDEKPDIIIFDIPPPYIENWNYLKLLQKAYPNIRFLAITTSKKALETHIGHSLPNLIDLMPKPFDLSVLLSKLHGIPDRS